MFQRIPCMDACTMHDTCMVHAQVYHSMHGAYMVRTWFSLSCMLHAWASFFHACTMHGSPAMHNTCMEGTCDTVNNNFGSKNSKQLQYTAAQIFSNFCEVCSSVAIAVELAYFTAVPKSRYSYWHTWGLYYIAVYTAIDMVSPSFSVVVFSGSYMQL